MFCIAFHFIFPENIYSCTKCLDGETIALELLDTATQQVESSRQEVNIKWADAYILMYAVTDRCSFNECSRLRLLISSYSKRVGKRTPGETLPNQPVVLVGNQIDREQDRMVSIDEGLSKAEEFNCVSFHEISVRESVDGIDKIFEDIYMSYKYPKRNGSMRTNSVPIPETRDHNGPKAVLHRRRQALHTIS
ncbi:hypothetical protein ACJMK2_030007 [Sinanodonta woodiana]|uniref:small monomeric GTPase n=1 Tax=Sinanodonta woodiana TaxID=1069815 RepID=A0ABD3XBX1_SINWO